MAPAKKFSWEPTEAILKNSRLTAFLNFVNAKDYDELERKSTQDPGWLWDNVIRFADFKFFKPYEKIMDDTRGPAWTRWCVGGTTNMVLNCIDRYRDTPVYDKTFMIWESEKGANRDLTYKEFDVQVCKFANALKQLGYQKGDVLGLYMPQVPETYIAYFAIIKIGGIVLPLFSGFGPQAVFERLALANAKGIVTVDVTYRKGKQIYMKNIIADGIDKVPTIEHVITVKHGDTDCKWNEKCDYWWHELVADQRGDAQTVEMEAEDPIVIHFTSGTTGKPKGCVYTHIGLITKMVFDQGILTDFKDTDRHFCMADMGWMVGSKSATIASVHGGSMLVAEGVPDYPEPGRYWKLIEKHQVTWVELAPALIRGQMAHGDQKVLRYNLDSLRIVCTGGEPWTEKPWKWLFTNVGKNKVPIMNSAGGTEVSGSILLCCLHRPLKVGSFNAPIPGMGADIVNNRGQVVKTGEMGELVMRHSSIGLTKSLWKNDERYFENYWNVIPNLWVHGDLASRDEDGHWYLHGRSDDIIKVSGKRVGPAEIENIIMQTGKVSGVAVVGIPDPLKGSEIIAACVMMPGIEPGEDLADEFIQFIAQSLGKSFKPKKILFVNDLPKTRNMKIMRRAVKSALTGQSLGDTSSLVNPDSLNEISKVALNTP
jgi:acetyl-CoA synthetase